ncbi:MAG TPA: alpha/beta hydrolase [Gammaproteobacteria bacterium]|nr:alpha/beta hydrolase [Gammaproteobacteria bacterium]
MRSFAGLLGAGLLATVLAGCATPQVAPAGGQPGTPHLEPHHAVMADGYRLPYSVWRPAGPPRAVVLALHGLNDYRHAYATVGPYLAGRGIVVYAYDQRGFGATEGRGLWHGTDKLVDDMRTLSRLLRRRHPGLPLYLLGESMGAAVLLAAQGDGQATVPADGMILTAPAVWARETMPFYQRYLLWLVAHTFPHRTFTGKGLKVTASDNIDMLRAQGRDPLVIKATRADVLWGLTNLMDRALAAAPKLHLPTLILYGERDEIIPKKPACRLLTDLTSSGNGYWQAVLYPRGYHMLTRDLQAERVLNDIVRWVLAPVKTTPRPAAGRAAAIERFCG